jgi:hypothetical protein
MIKDESHNDRDILIRILGSTTEDYVPKVSNLNACLKVRSDTQDKSIFRKMFTRTSTEA